LLLAAVRIEDLPSIISHPAGGTALIVIDLCTGQHQIIATFETKTIRSLAWGKNGLILCSNYVGPDVISLKENGDSIGTIPVLVEFAHNISWFPDQTSFLISSDIRSEISHIGLDGQVLSNDMNMGLNPGSDFLFLSETSIAYAGEDIGLYDIQLATHQLFEEIGVLTTQSDLAYSKPINSLFWCVADTLIGLTDLETGGRIDLTTGLRHERYYRSTSATDNGYLAYVAEITSPALSTNTLRYVRSEIRFINPDGADERRLLLDF
jgi:hypothetical protein